jgi:hypothetical protein
MIDTVTIPSHCIVTVRRPDGAIETINYTDATKGKVKEMTERVLSIVNKAMADAGRGQIVAYQNHTVTKPAPQPTSGELALDQYFREHNAILRASAGGELCDRV